MSSHSHGDTEERLRIFEQELSAQKQATMQLMEDNARLRSLVKLACSFDESKSLSEALQVIANIARDLLNSQASCIALFDKATGKLVIGRWSDEVGSDPRDRVFPIPERGAGSLAMQPLEGCIVDDCAVHGGTDAIVDCICEKKAGMTAMVAPVVTQSEFLGLIYVLRSQSCPFPKSQLDFLHLLGSLAGFEINRRRFEEKLKESEERFRFMAETTGDVLYRLSYQSMQYDYISPGILALTGYSPEELQSIGFSTLVQKIELLGMEHVSQETIRKRRLRGEVGEYRADYLISAKSGVRKWVRDHSFPWLDDQSHVIGSVGILSDVSDYKRAETRVQECTDDLIESEEKYRTLVENVPLVVYRMGSRGEILFVNGFFQEVFGYTSVEVYQDPAIWVESIYEADRVHVEDLRRRCYEEGNEFFAEYRVVHKDGQIVYILDHAVPYRDHDGKVVNLDGIIVDMTGKMRLQEHLLQTQDIKTISEVSERLAHEIRNPLVSAGGFARLLLNQMDANDPNRAKAEIIVKEVSRLEVILRMLLAYIQPLDLQLCDYDLTGMFDSILVLLEPQIRKKNIQLELQLPQGLPMISVDPLQMERAMGAIIENALNQSKLSSTLSISVLNKGRELSIGIRYSPEHPLVDDVEHFFYPFTSLTACQATPELPLSKIIINKHGGNAEVCLAEDGHMLIDIALPRSY